MPRMNRRTEQKKRIEKAISSTKGFFNAEELHKELCGVSLATIYRFLKEACERQEVYSYYCNRRRLYSRTKRSHCHFICEDTGRIVHFELDNIDFFIDKLPGSISSFQLEVTGKLSDEYSDKHLRGER